MMTLLVLDSFFLSFFPFPFQLSHILLQRFFASYKESDLEAHSFFFLNTTCNCTYQQQYTNHCTFGVQITFFE